MNSSDPFQPKAEDKFSFGLWTLGNRGRDPFGDFVRPGHITRGNCGHAGGSGRVGRQPARQRFGAHRCNAAASAIAIVREFQKACEQSGLVVPMATVPCSFTRFFVTARSPQTIRRSELTQCKKLCAPWIWGGTGREDFCSVGRPRRCGDGCLPAPR